MKTIIAATDFSYNSLHAVDYAAAMAGFMGDNLIIFHACPLPLAFGEVPVPVVTKEELLAEAEEKIAKLKKKILLDTHDRIPVTTVVKEGELVSQLEEYCADSDPFAVVIGTESVPPIERFLVGSAATSAVHRLSLPLIVVPKDATFSRIKKIGLACDFSRVAETMPVKQIEELVKNFQADLHVIHVNDQEDIDENKIIEESKHLEEILERLHPKYHFIDNEDIEGSINRYVDRHRFDLLIIIPKKRSLISKLFHHSHSKKMVLQAHIPVMSVHE
jgi:nucleotide-binding universal stress UspA family protein